MSIGYHKTPVCDLMPCIACAGYRPNSRANCVKILDQWQEFGDVPMDPETECIDAEWNGFEAGTHREEIWRWFEETYNISIYDLMYQ